MNSDIINNMNEAKRNHHFLRYLLSAGFFLVSVSLMAQSISLDTCIALAERNYPLIKKYDLLEQSIEYSVDNVGKGKLPRFNVVGQATYQSEVTSLPGGAGPVISKDQYRLYGEIVQPLTDLATVEKQKQLTESRGELEKQELAVSLYAIKERVSEMYLSIILLQNQQKAVLLTKESLITGLNTLEAGVKYGSVLSSQASLLKAELLTLEQKSIELESAKHGYIQMLQRFIGKAIEPDALFKEPEITPPVREVNRPELTLFNTQTQSLQLQQELINTGNLPKFSLFVQSGVGRPALNFLSNDLEFYYIGGLRLNWDISGFYTSKKAKENLMLRQDIVNAQRETFLFNTNLQLDNWDVQIEKSTQLIEKDHEIIGLRESVRKTAQNQLENGVITAAAFKDVVKDENVARQNLAIHKIELLQVKQRYILSTGNF
ncbi:MAG: TolC family protein [Cyclobacteriaceae bacterium]